MQATAEFAGGVNFYCLYHNSPTRGIKKKDYSCGHLCNIGLGEYGCIYRIPIKERVSQAGRFSEPLGNHLESLLTHLDHSTDNHSIEAGVWFRELQSLLRKASEVGFDVTKYCKRFDDLKHLREKRLWAQIH